MTLRDQECNAFISQPARVWEEYPGIVHLLDNHQFAVLHNERLGTFTEALGMRV